MKAIALFIFPVVLFSSSGCSKETPATREFEGYWSLQVPIELKGEAGGATKFLVISGRTAVVHRVEASPGQPLPEWMGSDSSSGVSFHSQVWEGTVNPEQNTLIVAEITMKLGIRKYETWGPYEKDGTTILEITYPDGGQEHYWRVPPSES